MGMKEAKQKLRYLDPFTYVDMLLERINPGKNPLIDWPVYLISAFLIAYVIYGAMGFALNTSAPMVIVVSESMSPTMHRGDVVMLLGTSAEHVNAKEINTGLSTLQGVPLTVFAMSEDNTLVFSDGQRLDTDQSGDIIVYFSEFRNEQVIHRAVAKLRAADGAYLITKGDNWQTNTAVDQDCGMVVAGIPERNCVTLFPLTDSDLQGKAVLRVPLLGYVKLLLIDDVQVLLFGCQRPEGCTLP